MRSRNRHRRDAVLAEVTARTELIDLTPPSERQPASRWRSVALAGFAAALLLVVAFGLVQPTAIVPIAREVEPAASCAGRSWPMTEISCVAAENRSITASVPLEGSWTVRIWLTTMGAVDARLHPRRQVANQPPSAEAPVWMFVYEHASGERLLYVAPASNARPGEFVYIYRFSELGSPETPRTMPPTR